jgi:hypothetical protein
VAIHSQEPTGVFLEFNSRQRQWLPFTGWLFLDLRDLRDLRCNTSLEEDDDDCPVEQPVALPIEDNIDIIAAVSNFDVPKRFRNKILNSEITINNEAKGRELAETCDGLR